MLTSYHSSLIQSTIYLQKSIFSTFYKKPLLLIASVALAALAIISVCRHLHTVGKTLIALRVVKRLPFETQDSSFLLSYLAAHGKSIEELNLKDMYLTDEDLVSIGKYCPQLQILSLNNLDITDVGLRAVTKLKSLNLVNCPKITKASIETLNNLTNLTLEDCHGIQSLNLHTLSALETLTLKRDMFRSRIDNVDHFFEGKGSFALRNLFLECSPGYDHQLAAIATLFPQLHALDILTCNVTDSGLAELSKCKHLNSLGLNYLGGHINGAGFSSLPHSIRNLSLHFWQIDALKSHELQSLKTLSSLKSFTLNFDLPTASYDPSSDPFSTDPISSPCLNLSEEIKKVVWLPDLFGNLAPSLKKIYLKGRYIFPIHLSALSKVASPSFNLEIDNAPYITRDDLEPLVKLNSIPALSSTNCIKIYKDCEIIKSIELDKFFKDAGWI